MTEVAAFWDMAGLHLVSPLSSVVRQIGKEIHSFMKNAKTRYPKSQAPAAIGPAWRDSGRSRLQSALLVGLQ